MEQATAVELAREYMRLGGHRLSKIDDDHVATRTWEHDTPEAEAYWNENIEPLDERHKREVITLLPSINQV
ncbi:hypothetical protein OCK02_23095 [Rhizobium sp. TRM96647]|uniref:hypothetical protein n=1 Tax=unclassified Rhizobium TaxID=2613769 RepID=UPI001E5984AE|nr:MULTISPECIES: hypothetical protein [unclassified Rhizobium]MCD2184513.1 hypothetical protein [Rhizobium sp. GN54]MCV3739065.1 hypothetical protein [Rhizobium sp. TRM96647]MCV3760792.1 hypothetical protein [Rhizobium sp. TRM96650]